MKKKPPRNHAEAKRRKLEELATQMIKQQDRIDKLRNYQINLEEDED